MKLPGLRAAREAKLFTQNELAKRAGLTDQTISNLEKGGFARCSSAHKIAKALGVKVETLLEASA